MSDEPSDNDQVWWMPPDQPDPADQEEPQARSGWLHSERIGPMGLRWGSRRPYIIAGVAAAALLGGAGATLAATGTPTPAASSSAVITNPTPSPGLPGPARPGSRPDGRAFWLGGGMFGALHGQFVVPKPGGGYQTVDVQTGQVTAVSSTSISLKSSDGFTKSYVVTGSTIVDAQRDGIGSIKVGNQASVQATVSGITATASGVEDLTLLQQNHMAFGFPGFGGMRPQTG